MLDELTGAAPAPPDPASGSTPARPARRTRPAPAPEPAPVTAAPQRTPIRVQIPDDLADRVRGAVAALAYRDPAWSSLNAATTAALGRFVAAAEKAYNDGEPFPWTPGRQLQPGRRVGH